jgi:hypothetical protein
MAHRQFLPAILFFHIKNVSLENLIFKETRKSTNILMCKNLKIKMHSNSLCHWDHTGIQYLFAQLHFFPVSVNYSY